jgi:hypothetical protein
VDPSLIESEVKEADDNIDITDAEFAESSSDIDQAFGDLSVPERIEEVFPFLVEHDIYVESSLVWDEDQFSAGANASAKYRASEPLKRPQMEEEQIDPPVNEFEDKSSQSTDQSQMRIFDEEKIVESDQEAKDNIEEFDEDAGVDPSDEPAEDTDEDSDEDDELYEYTYEDDF